MGELLSSSSTFSLLRNTSVETNAASFPIVSISLFIFAERSHFKAVKDFADVGREKYIIS